jgi:hypothetical protein
MKSLGDVFRVLKRTHYGDGLELIPPAYHWLVDHHGGQGSWEYAAQCRLSRVYDPGPSYHPAHEKDSPDYMHYLNLCYENGCCERERLKATLRGLQEHGADRPSSPMYEDYCDMLERYKALDA